MWTQIVGKVKLALSPPMNHWWHAALQVTDRGLASGPIPYQGRTLGALFDLLDHELVLTSSDDRVKALPLLPRSVAAFYDEVLAALHALGVDVHIWRKPVEVADPIPFDEDRVHTQYDPEFASRFHRVLLQTDAALRTFAGRFQGKQSPPSFWWGTFDIAGNRFSGRPAPPRPGADRITREAYSHEQMCFGWWPGGGPVDAAFYAYAAPPPDGFSGAPVRPAAARWEPAFSEFILPYEDVRRSPAPADAILEFFQSVYDGGADLAHWDRAALDRAPRAAEGAAAGGHPAEQPPAP
jgi:hypothetical protein